MFLTSSPIMLSVPLSSSWYIMFGHELIWKNREPFVKLWHELRTRGGPGGDGGGAA